jgi:hypothetical protein
MEVAVYRIDQDGERGSVLEGASLSELEDSFRPMVSFVARGPKAALRPGITLRTLCEWRKTRWGSNREAI